jgi:hypothetical protein
MMKKFMVNMVHPQQIVQKGLKGCKTTRTVTSFAQKNGVPYVWWKPTANQKVMLVDWTQFRQVWTKFGTNPTTKNNNTQTYGSPTTRNYPTKTNQKAIQCGTRTTTKTRSPQTRYSRTNTRKTNYGTTTTRRRIAA